MLIGDGEVWSPPVQYWLSRDECCVVELIGKLSTLGMVFVGVRAVPCGCVLAE